MPYQATSPSGFLGGVHLEPVEITIQGDHAFKKKTGARGCGVVLADGSLCGKRQAWAGHLSLPLSLNKIQSGGGYRTFVSFKSAWQEMLCEHLEGSDLPAGWREDAPSGTPQIELVTVEAQLCFPVARFARDQGNFRWFLEKCLGDALSSGYGYSTGTKKAGTYEWHQVNPGGWIKDDCIYPVRRYDFGGLEIEHRPGESWTRLMIFPRL